jgi:hypothetical protein
MVVLVAPKWKVARDVLTFDGSSMAGGFRHPPKTKACLKSIPEFTLL